MIQVHNPTITDLKCPTCLINFDTLLLHKEHYKSDFHRYNLKRKMVKLAPATFEQFKSKRGEAQAEQQTEDFKCNQCGKKFASAKTLDQHTQTKKHNPNVAKTEQSTTKAPKPKAQFKKNSKQCLFCKNQSPTFSENLRHMQSTHSFFIAQLHFCTNQQGLIEYLQQKIEVGFLCITCQNKNAKDFNSGQAVRKHMIDKGHTFMKVDEDYDEYLEYYDFSSQFKQILQSQKDKIVPGIQFTTMKVVVKDGQHKQEGNQQDWEDQEDDQPDNSKQNTIKQKQGDDQWQSEEQNEKDQQIKEKQQKQQPKKSKVRTYHIMRPTHTANGQLLLPNGKILGHRKYRYLYRQTYRTPFWLNQNIKALGYQFTNNSIITRQKMMQLAKHDRLIFNAKHRCDKRMLRDGMQNNILQKYFRTRNSL